MANKRTEPDLAKKLNGFFKQGTEGNRNWKDRAKEDYKFYWGDQWNEEDKNILKASRKPALTFNRIFPTVNVLSGIERQNRDMVRVYPRKGGTEKVSQALTELVKHTYDTSNAHYGESMMFLDGLICGKGWLTFDIDYQYDPFNGDLVLERESPFRVIEDPDSNSYDLNRDGRFIIRTYWWTEEELIMNFPKKKKEIEGGVLESMKETSPEEIVSTDDGGYKEPGEIYESAVFGKQKKRKYKVKEIFWREWKRRDVFINKETYDAVVVQEKNKKLIEKLQEKAGSELNFKIIERVLPFLHKTTMVGNVVLETEEDPFNGFHQFPFVRFCPYWVDGVTFGVVHNIKDPQREHNKRMSQLLHILNTQPNSGWLGPKGWYAGDEDDLETFGSKPGINIEYMSGKKPEQITAANPSQGHFLLGENAKQAVKEISGASADLMGHDKTASESGIAMQLRQRQGLLVSECIFDNFAYSRQILGQGLVEIIRESGIYSPQEIKAVLHESIEDLDISQLQDFKTGRYGIRVEKNPNQPTIKMANFLMLLEAAKAGLPIPPQDIIELSDLPNKESIINHMQELQGQAPPQAGGQPPAGAPGGRRSPVPPTPEGMRPGPREQPPV